MTVTEHQFALSVVVCTHNPERNRLKRVINALASQDLPRRQFEVLIVDNRSEPPLTPEDFSAPEDLSIRILSEPELGLSHARARGFSESSADVVLLVDDDNELSSNYVRSTLAFFDEYPDIGALGGPCLPEFDGPIPDWSDEFLPLLAVRDLGDKILIHPGSARLSRGYPPFSPIGAGMAIRTHLARDWMASRRTGPITLTDRHGANLSSAGDNDIVLHALGKGFGVAYVPDLRVTHLLPAKRLSPNYLMRLNEGIQSSWMRVLYRHDANPWPQITRYGAWLRTFRAWFRLRAWRGPVERIRFAGVKGHFLGRCR